MPEHVTTPNANQPTNVRGIVVGIAAVAFVVLCGVYVLGANDKPETYTRVPCEHFRNVANDASAGILTGPELRTKMQEVQRDAAGSPPEVQAAATSALRGLTLSDPTAWTDGVRDLNAACAKYGS